MVNQKLLDYVRAQISRGVPLQEIKKELVSLGWQPLSVDEAINFLKHQKSKTPVKSTIPKKEYSESIREKIKIPKKILVLVAVVAIALTLLVFFDLHEITIHLPTFSDDPVDVVPLEESCGRDTDCFLFAAKTCSNVDLQYAFISGTYGEIDIRTDMYYQIKGYENGNCKFQAVIVSKSARYSVENLQKKIEEGISLLYLREQEIAVMDSPGFSDDIGKRGTCWFNSNEDLEEILRISFEKNELIGISCTPEECTSVLETWDGAVCEGELFLKN